MNWKDRKTVAAYTSPSGIRAEFKYEDVRAQINKRDSIREVPDFDGALVQNFGIGVSSYPLLCIFWGDNHDIESTDFLNLLAEPGFGILEHPIYGRFENIVPFGPIGRLDALKTAANQTSFEVNFVQSAAFQFPGSSISAGDQIEFDLDDFYVSQASAFEDGIRITKASEKISMIDSVKSKLGNVRRFMARIAATVQEIENEFNSAISLIENNINTLVGTPLALANQIIDLVKLPARASSQISATLDAYKNLLESSISDANGLFSPGVDNTVNNQFFNSELFSNAAFASMLEASKVTADATQEISGQSLEDFISVAAEETPAFTTKDDILNTIEVLDGEASTLNTWNEANRAALDLLDTGEAYTDLKRAWAGVSGFLIEISFSARQERFIILTEPRNFIELCAELYGILDNAFDFIILTNDLTGDEIFELPRGRLLRYYV
jgi:prophage DNA circulation protein